MTKYTVFGVWLDGYQPFAASAEATTPDQAVDLVLAEYTGPDSPQTDAVLVISGVACVVNGEIEVVL